MSGILDTVRDYLLDHLAPDAKAEPGKSIAKFIHELYDENQVNSIRLMLCMAIDVKTSIGILNTKEIAENSVIIALRDCISIANRLTINLKSGPCSARLKFCVAQRNISPAKYLPCINCATRANYARVYNFRSYMLYVVGINRDYNDGIDKIESNQPAMVQYMENFDKQRMYHDVKVTNLGKSNQWIFVADKQQLRSVGYDKTLDIVNGLGLYTNNAKGGTKYVCMEYDDDFNEDTFQPDSLTGDWGNVDNAEEKEGNDYYLSFYKYDEFGRTYPISGSNDNHNFDNRFKERVHRDFAHNGSRIYTMFGEDLGILSDNVDKGKDEDLILEAYVRFLNA